MIYISFHEPHKKFKILCSYRDILLIFLLLFCQIHLFHFSSLFYPLIYFFNACKENLWLSYVICVHVFGRSLFWDGSGRLQRTRGLGRVRRRKGGFEREGTCVYLWLIHVDVWQKPTQYCKTIILQLKINKFKIFLKRVKASQWRSVSFRGQLKRSNGWVNVHYVFII